MPRFAAPALLAFLVVLIAACGSGSPGTTPTPAATSGSLTTGPAATSAAPATNVVTLTPVDSHGNVVAGWTATLDPSAAGAADCSGNYGAVAGGLGAGNIYGCSPEALGADTCWVAADGVDILCLRDPFGTALVEMAAGQLPTAPAAYAGTAEPLGLVLDDGDQCRLVTGGSWEPQATDPSLGVAYTCHADGYVWTDFTGPDVIDTSSPLWTVTAAQITGPLTTRSVTTAYFVGTAS